MARYAFGMTAAGAGTSVRPIIGLLSTASVTPIVYEFAMFNTTATAAVYRLVRFTGGTAGADQTEGKMRADAPAASCVSKGLWTADATIDEDLGYRIELPGIIGGGGVIPVDAVTGVLGTTKGIGLVPVGTGQVAEAYMRWEE